VDPAAARLSPLLDRLVNYERDRPNQALWDLAVTSALLARPGAAAAPRPAVQVGGSKGKGSTCAMLGALARRAGLSVGIYTSPHVTTLLERIAVDGESVPVDELERILAGVLAAPGERAPTFFEAMTVAAAQWFAERRVDLAVYEVGLGGRLDATTALPVDLSILTTIELEHTEILGDTVAAIAREKAAILRPGGTALTTATGEALPQLQARADEVGAKLLVVDRDFGAVRVRDRGDVLTGNLWLPDRLVPFELRGGALFDLSALAVAACGLETLRPGVLGKELAMARPQAPCRFEVFEQPDGGAVVLDGAHTERSMAAVADELRRRWPGRKFDFLFGSASGKRWRESLSSLLPLVDTLKVTAVSGTSSEDPSLIAAYYHARGIAAEQVDDVGAGLAALAKRGGIRVVVGSFYLVGEARRLLVSAAANLT
jgi:dihydrofolate synthase/folylpolyglutamate synthase